MIVTEEAMVVLFHANGIKSERCPSCGKTYSISGMRLYSTRSATFGKIDIKGGCPGAQCFGWLVEVRAVREAEVRYAQQQAEARSI